MRLRKIDNWNNPIMQNNPIFLWTILYIYVYIFRCVDCRFTKLFSIYDYIAYFCLHDYRLPITPKVNLQFYSYSFDFSEASLVSIFCRYIVYLTVTFCCILCVVFTASCPLSSSYLFINVWQDSISRSSESSRSVVKEKTPPQEKDKKNKKAWYSSVLNPTYKSRSDDLKRLFKDLPSDERLIVG